jgi:hypothetical protein
MNLGESLRKCFGLGRNFKKANAEIRGGRKKA